MNLLKNHLLVFSELQQPANTGPGNMIRWTQPIGLFSVNESKF